MSKNLSTSKLTPVAMALAGAAFAAGGILHITHPFHGPQNEVEGTVGYIQLGLLATALLALVPGFLALGARATSNKGAVAAAAGGAVLACLCITSMVNGKDLDIFPAVAVPSNAAWLLGSIALAISMKKAGRTPKPIYRGLPLTWVAALPMNAIGGGLIAGAYWMAVAYFVNDEQSEEAPSTLAV